MKKLFALILLAVSSSAWSACDQFLAWGFPKSEKRTVDLCHISYYTAWDSVTKNPQYSAELLLKENVTGVEERINVFRQHPQISAALQASNSDYAKTGYDRGHMAAAGNMRKDSAAMKQSFYLTNMVPQFPGLNRGEWSYLEAYVRNKVKVDRPVYVISGPIYSSQQITTIGKGVWVPSHTFKLVYDKNSNKLASYIMPNIQTVEGKIETYYVELSKVETLTNIKFFPTMPIETVKNLKQGALTKSW